MDTSPHIRYFQRCLGLLPSKYEAEDANRLVLVYLCLCGLDLVQPIPESYIRESRRQYIDWIYLHAVETADLYGFVGSETYLGCGAYTLPNLAYTCFALQILLTLGDDYSRIPRQKLMSFVIKCQRSNGSFTPMLDSHGSAFGEEDLRYCMLASTVRKLIKWDCSSTDIDLGRLHRYVVSTRCFDGGLSEAQGAESHAGLTFCGLNTLKLIGRLDPQDWIDTVDFLVHRQIQYTDYNTIECDEDDIEDDGGFNGRINKPADTCYGFWCIWSLRLLGQQDLWISKRLLGI